MTTYLSVMGTRPEIIKMAILQRTLHTRGDRALVLHTGQHGEVADVLYEYFEIVPDRRMPLERRSNTLAHLTSLLLEGVNEAIEELRPDVVLVQGDTTSALAGALAAYYRGIPIAHVEAGLRTGQREPFPEEKNRELIGRLATWHFAPTSIAAQNLRNEGVDGANIFQVGNTVIDAALWAGEQLRRNGGDAGKATPAALREFLAQHSTRRLVLVTAHRRENWGQPIRDIAHAIGALVADHPDVIAVWPVHPNPQVRDDVDEVVSNLPISCRQRICLTDPLDYPALLSVLTRCHFTLTDSGGIQEEASALGRPVLIARSSTERSELVDAGGALLVGTDVAEILKQSSRLLYDESARQAMQLKTSPFGDGHSARRIADILSDATT